MVLKAIELTLGSGILAVPQPLVGCNEAVCNHCSSQPLSQPLHPFVPASAPELVADILGLGWDKVGYRSPTSPFIMSSRDA